MGIKVRLTKSEAATARTITTVRDEKNTPTSPEIKARGRSTTAVVRVEATSADPTSPAPRTAAMCFLSPSSIWWIIWSVATMELSTTIPEATASADNVKIFMV